MTWKEHETAALVTIHGQYMFNDWHGWYKLPKFCIKHPGQQLVKKVSCASAASAECLLQLNIDVELIRLSMFWIDKKKPKFGEETGAPWKYWCFLIMFYPIMLKVVSTSPPRTHSCLGTSRPLPSGGKSSNVKRNLTNADTRRPAESQIGCWKMFSLQANNPQKKDRNQFDKFLRSVSGQCSDYPCGPHCLSRQVCKSGLPAESDTTRVSCSLMHVPNHVLRQTAGAELWKHKPNDANAPSNWHQL